MSTTPSKQALRDLQSRLAERLQAARTEERAQGWLAAECRGHGFLLPLREAGEISTVVPIAPVPYSRPWFLGLANLRGQLHGVVDLAAFLGLPEREPGRGGGGAGVPQPHLIGFNAALELNCVLRVDRLAGLRGDDDLTPEPAPPARPAPAFAGRRFRDASGRSWQEIRLAELARNDDFLTIRA